LCRFCFHLPVACAIVHTTKKIHVLASEIRESNEAVLSKCDSGAAPAGGGGAGAQAVVGVVVVRHAVLGDVVLLPVAPQCVRLLPVRGVVSHQQELLIHAQRHDEPDDVQNDARHHYVPADDEQRAGDLLAELPAPPFSAVESTLLVRHGQEEVAQMRLREQPRQHPAQGPRHCMSMKNAQRVVHPLQQRPALVHHHHGEPRNTPRANPHQNRRPALHHTCQNTTTQCSVTVLQTSCSKTDHINFGCISTCSRRDDHQSSNHALHRADHGRLAEHQHIQQRPHEQTGGRAHIGVDHRHGGIDVSRVRISSVEPRPSQPQQPRPRQHEQHVVRWEPLPVPRQPRPNLNKTKKNHQKSKTAQVCMDNPTLVIEPCKLTYPEGGGEAGDTGGEMDDVAAGVVDDAPLEEEAAAPEAEGAHGVGEGEPERDEEHPRDEVHAAEEGAGQEDERDGREDELKVDHGGERVEGRQRRGLQRAVLVVVDGGGQVSLREQRPVAEHRARLPPDRQQLLPERHLVRVDHPAQQHCRERVERHERRVHGPFLLHDTPVQNHQPGHRLQPHQRRGRQLPCVVALVQPVGHHPARVLVRRRHRRRRHLHTPLALFPAIKLVS
jgi:hypothetical protein